MERLKLKHKVYALLRLLSKTTRAVLKNGSSNNLQYIPSQFETIWLLDIDEYYQRLLFADSDHTS